MPDAPETRPPAKSPALAALLARPGRWFGFGAALASSLYLARMLSLLVREAVGHGAVVALVGGRYESYVVSPWLQASAHWFGVPAGRQWIVLWGGTAAEVLLGLGALWAFRRKPRPLRTASLVLFALVVASLGGAISYALWGAFVGTGDTADLYDLPLAVQVGVVVVLFAALFVLVRWVVSVLLRWTEEQFVPADRRQRVACFLLAVALPVSILAGVVAYGGFPRYVNRAEVALATALPLLLFAAYGAWRAARFAFPLGVIAVRRIHARTGLAWLALAGAAFAATAHTARSVQVGLGEIPPRPVPRFEASFPRTRLTPGLVDASVELRLPKHARHRQHAKFTQGPDGTRALWRGIEGEFRALDAALAPHETFRVPADVQGFGWVRPAGSAPIALTLSNDMSELTARPLGSPPLWSYRGPAYQFVPNTVLYGERGPTGVAFGPGEEKDRALVAWDLKGTEVWRLSIDDVFHLDTDPRLPGALLCIGAGEATLFEGGAAGEPPRPVLGGKGALAGRALRLSGDFSAEWGWVLPDAAGRPALLLVQNDYGRRRPPAIVRVDADGTEVWRAELPSRPSGGDFIEPEQGPRLFLFTTQGGDILVVGDDGTLYARERMPHARDVTATYAWDFSAGAFRGGGWGAAYSSEGTVYVHRLHPEVLDTR